MDQPVTWDACTLERFALLRWMECHPALGSYLTLLAIIVAVWATIVTIRAEQRRMEARGRVIAFRLSPFIASIHADVERALQCVAALEPGSNVFSEVAPLIQNLIIPTQIPNDIFCETWTMRPEIALFVARLESALANYTTVSAQPGLGSIGVIPQKDRTNLLTDIRNMLNQIDEPCLIVSEHCTRVAAKAIVPFWRRLFARQS